MLSPVLPILIKYPQDVEVQAWTLVVIAWASHQELRLLHHRPYLFADIGSPYSSSAVYHIITYNVFVGACIHIRPQWHLKGAVWRCIDCVWKHSNNYCNQWTIYHQLIVPSSMVNESPLKKCLSELNLRLRKVMKLQMQFRDTITDESCIDYCRCYHNMIFSKIAHLGVNRVDVRHPQTDNIRDSQPVIILPVASNRGWLTNPEHSSNPGFTNPILFPIHNKVLGITIQGGRRIKNSSAE